MSSNTLEVSRNRQRKSAAIFGLQSFPTAIGDPSLKEDLKNILPELCNKASNEDLLAFYDFKNGLSQREMLIV